VLDLYGTLHDETDRPHSERFDPGRFVGPGMTAFSDAYVLPRRGRSGRRTPLPGRAGDLRAPRRRCPPARLPPLPTRRPTAAAPRPDARSTHRRADGCARRPITTTRRRWPRSGPVIRRAKQRGAGGDTNRGSASTL
jgi:hypothetical protein